MKLIILAVLTFFTGQAFCQVQPNLNWSYATPVASPIANTTPVALKAAAGANAKNYLTGVQIYNTSATVSTIVTILNGSTVIWTGYVPAVTAALPLVPIEVNFQTPLNTSVNTALNFVANTTSAAIFVSAQGYTAR